MAETDKNSLVRRDFLKSAAAIAVLGGTCLGSGLKQAMAAAKQAKKPLLSEKGINDFIQSQSKDQLRRLMQEARTDLRAFLRRHFYVAPQQEQELTALPEAEIRKLNDALGTALKQDLKPQTKFATAKVAPPTTSKAHVASQPQGRSIHIGISVLGHEFLNITIEKPAKT